MQWTVPSSWASELTVGYHTSLSVCCHPEEKKPVGEQCVHPPFCQKDYTDARGWCMWTAGWHRYKDWQQEPVDFMWANTASSLGTVTLRTVQGTSHGVWRLLPPKVIKNLHSAGWKHWKAKRKLASCIHTHEMLQHYGRQLHKHATVLASKGTWCHVSNNAHCFSESPQDTPLLKIISCITLNCFSVPISYTVDSSGLAVFI